jgi:two-component system sensor histidine kinase CpxA
LAAKSIAKGKLSTRVGRFKGHHRDELAKLSYEFDSMAEQLEVLVDSKERLLQDISHELRSPLARLQIAIELGRNKTGGRAELEFQRMEMECLRLNTLIGEILEFARLDKSVDQLNRTHVPVIPLLQKLVEDANFEFDNSKSGKLQDTSPVQALYVDERLIHRAIENILRNAYRYSPPDEAVTIELSTDPSKQYFFIDILDRGPGVPDEQLETIFNPFYRVDTSREKKTGGYGLGLAIADKAAKQHQGTITAMNRKNGGLCVRITLPIQDAPSLSL